MTTHIAVLLVLLWGPCGPPTLLDDGGCLELPVSAVVRVYDGDTLTIRVPGWPPLVAEISVRLTGYDTPEIRGRCETERLLALRARESLVGALADGQTVHLDDVQPGKYFRLTASLSIDGDPIADRLIASGLARPYDGGRRRSWCE